MVVSWASRPVGVPSCTARLAPQPRRAPPRPDPPVVCPGFGLGTFMRGMSGNSSVVGLDQSLVDRKGFDCSPFPASYNCADANVLLLPYSCKENSI